MRCTWKLTSAAILTVSLAVAMMGCPPVVTGDTKVVTLFGANGAAKLLESLKADVALDDIDAFWVTITEISLDQAGTGAGADSKIVVFSGALEVNLKNLLDVSEVISTADVPSGQYTKIRLSIEDPKLHLASDPETALTDIQLTANGRLFVSQQFELPEGQTSLVQLTLDGIKLVEQGNGGYTLTPQMDVALDITDAAASVTGAIQTIDMDANTMTVALAEGSMTVNYTTAALWLDTDVDTPSGTEAQLVVGATVTVNGLMHVDGTLTATAVLISTS